MRPISRASEARAAVLAALALGVLTWSYRTLQILNPTIVALSLLTVVLAVAATATLRLAVATSVVAMVTFNYFFLPPFFTLTISEPQNWVALIVFLAVSLVASNLSTAARARAYEATARRDELARLFDLTRDVLLTTESRDAVAVLARHIARRFDLDYAGICLPRGTGEWDVHAGGMLTIALDPRELSGALAGASRALEFDARERTYAGHRVISADGHEVRLVPLRLGTKAIGLLAAHGRAIEPGTLDALAGVAAIAIERAQFLEDRKVAELAKQSEELKSALLASLGHDLKTPLTAIRVAAGNLQSTWLSDDQRREQTDVVSSEVGRLSRLFENILDMARIDAGAVAATRQWVLPAEIADAARAQVEHALKDHAVDVRDDSSDLVLLDPRLAAAALAHLLANAGTYSPAGAPITVTIVTSNEGLRLTVHDRGPGIATSDLPHLFNRFFRGTAGAGTAGTGMGLSIARGLLAVEHGRVWAENHPEGGAVFTIEIPATTRPAATTVGTPA